MSNPALATRARFHTRDACTHVTPPPTAHLKVGIAERERCRCIGAEGVGTGLPSGAAQRAHALQQALLGSIWEANGGLEPAEGVGGRRDGWLGTSARDGKQQHLRSDAK